MNDRNSERNEIRIISSRKTSKESFPSFEINFLKQKFYPGGWWQSKSELNQSRAESV